MDLDTDVKPKIKSETTSDGEEEGNNVPSLVDKVLTVLKKYEPKGVSTDALEKEIGVNMESIVEPINELLSKQAIELLRQGTQLLYRIADTSSFRGMLTVSRSFLFSLAKYW
jgi:hypothetical protein